MHIERLIESHDRLKGESHLIGNTSLDRCFGGIRGNLNAWNNDPETWNWGIYAGVVYVSVVYRADVVDSNRKICRFEDGVPIGIERNRGLRRIDWLAILQDAHVPGGRAYR